MFRFNLKLFPDRRRHHCCVLWHRLKEGGVTFDHTLFHFYFCLFNQIIQIFNLKNVLQYLAPGFELTTSLL